MTVDNTETQILLVEDDPHDAELTMRVLKQRQLSEGLVWVKDGVEALEFIFGPNHPAKNKPLRKPRLILLDLKMPKLSGVQVLEQLKSNIASKAIPVVMLTSSREDRDLKTCYELGVNSYIVKPVEFEEFAKAVTEVGLYWIVRNEPVRHGGDGQK